MPIGHSPLRLFAFATGARILDAIPPFALLYSASAFIFSPAHPSSLLFPHVLHPVVISLLSIYLYIEAAFLLFFFVKHLDFQKSNVVSVMSKADREYFLARIIKEMDGADFYRFLSGWFFWKNRNETQLTVSDLRFICRDNIRDWLAWSFFSRATYADLIAEPDGQSLAADLEECIATIERAKRVVFPPGRNPNISPVTLSHNAVRAYPKPLVLYMAIYLCESLGYLLLRLWGFDKYSPYDPSFSAGKLSPDQERSITYWMWDPESNRAGSSSGSGSSTSTFTSSARFTARRPSFSFGPATFAMSRAASIQSANSSLKNHPDNTPIVFFHGIGGGLFCYAYFIYALLTANRHRAIFLVEQPYVSMRLVQHVPHIDQAVAEVTDMLHVHGYDGAYFVGHSLGTALCAWMINNNAKVVKGVALLDPITFMTYHPSLAYNFVHRHPGKNATPKANELLMHWLVSRELYISQYISRHFCWHRTVLFPESLPEKHHVFISLDDNLIDGHLVERYVDRHSLNYSSYKLDHAQFVLIPKLTREIVRAIGQAFDGVDAPVDAVTEPTAALERVAVRRIPSELKIAASLGVNGAVQPPSPTTTTTTTTAALRAETAVRSGSMRKKVSKRHMGV